MWSSVLEQRSERQTISCSTGAQSPGCNAVGDPALLRTSHPAALGSRRHSGQYIGDMTGTRGWSCSSAQRLRLTRRKRREKMLQEGCFTCALLFLVWCLAGLIQGPGKSTSS